MYKAIIKPLAKKDIQEAKKYYRGKQDGLDKRFTDELKEYIRLIRQFPFLFEEKKIPLRAFGLKSFPYIAYYSFENDTIYIHAVIAAKKDHYKLIHNLQSSY